jgi:hypothetical protein
MNVFLHVSFIHESISFHIPPVCRFALISHIQFRFIPQVKVRIMRKLETEWHVLHAHLWRLFSFWLKDRWQIRSNVTLLGRYSPRKRQFKKVEGFLSCLSALEIISLHRKPFEIEIEIKDQIQLGEILCWSFSIKVQSSLGMESNHEMNLYCIHEQQATLHQERRVCI